MTTTTVRPLDVVLDGRLAESAERLAATLPSTGRVGVAFSGGVDSTVLLALCARTLGVDRVVAITGTSASLAARELIEARHIAALIGVELVELPTAEGQLPAYQRNDIDRCFHCKDVLFSTIEDRVIADYQLNAVAYGETADDLIRDDRPGAAAATRHRVLRPLAAAKLGKKEIRALAAALHLPNADKPAAPCLASRIPHGSPVTPEKLAQVERAENALHDLGFPEVRVRHHGPVAVIAVPAARVDELAVSPVRDQAVAAVRAAGFDVVSVDLAGLRSGSLHQLALRRPHRAP